ncbi:hypothetical protein [Agathobaculum sp. Marseille-P7918]|uniref:hypothetical protein n=1 Tax=Agathobaculum sp. Marseille-P7918 TaxID=2479843 RepID=UPI000F63C579|nr:hypothetical protein [Agathobaculum sp. Marseille-P7918]
MKKQLSLVLAATLMLSLAACGSGETPNGGASETEVNATQEAQSGSIQSKGLFLIERAEGDELDDLTAQETYLIHVYDIVPDESKNVDMGVFESNYSITMNGVNTYEPLYAPASYSLDSPTTPNRAQYFMLASGYAAPPELGTVLAGGDPIRAMSIYKINTNDIKDNMTATFTVDSCDVFDCEINFDRDDIISIARFDDVFQIEDNPTDYQIAAAYFQRVKTICNNSMTGTLFNKLGSNGLTSYQDGITVIKGWYDYAVFSATQLEGFTEELADAETAIAPDDIPRFDREAVKRVHPDLPVDEFEDALASWLTNGQTALDALSGGQDSGEAGDLADTAIANMQTYGPQIIAYYTAKLSNQ